jgi:hypothetical protein
MALKTNYFYDLRKKRTPTAKCLFLAVHNHLSFKALEHCDLYLTFSIYRHMYCGHPLKFKFLIFAFLQHNTSDISTQTILIHRNKIYTYNSIPHPPLLRNRSQYD